MAQDDVRPMRRHSQQSMLKGAWPASGVAISRFCPVLTGRQVFKRSLQVRCARVHRVDRQPIVSPGRELSPAPQDAFPGGLGESLDAPGSVLYPVPEDAVVAALDDDELQLGIRLAGEITPLSTSGLWSV